MMVDEKLTISWNDFEKEAPNTFRNLFTDQDFRDVTLVSADSKLISAHKVVLSSSSPLFRNILTRSPLHQSPLIFLKGVNFLELDLLVRFVYIGECEVAQEHLDTFLELGKELEINGLRDDESNQEENLPKDQIENNKFKCHSCEFKFTNRDYLTRHIQAKHTENSKQIMKFENQNDESDTTDKKVTATDVNETSPEDYVGEKEANFEESKKSSVEDIFQTLMEGYNSLDTDKNKEGKEENQDQVEENLPENFEEGKTPEETTRPGQEVNSGEVFPCKVDKCSFVSTCKRGLKRHKTMKHIKSGRLVCEIGKCKFKSKFKSGLKRHQTLKHDKKQRDMLVI